MILVRPILIKVNYSPLMCALTLIFYTYKVKNLFLFCVAKIVTAIVLECCSPYSDTENSVRDLINSRLERNLTYRF